MNILAIDTTTKKASVALQYNNKIVDISEENEITHSEKLLPLIDTILTNNNLKINDIDLFAVLNGPGSFTGVRIGLATIKAFTMINNKEIFAISSLEAIAFSTYQSLNTNDEKYILSLIDAKNNRVYYGLFKISTINDKVEISDMLKQENDLIENIPEIVSKAIPSNINYIVAGNIDQALFKDYFQNSKYMFIYPTTKDIILSYNKMKNLDKYIYNTYTLDAKYIRPSQAERVKNEQSNK